MKYSQHWNLIDEFEQWFQHFHKYSEPFAIFTTPFLDDITVIKTRFQMKWIELQSGIQLKKKKKKCNQPSLFDFYKLYLSKETYPVLHGHTLLIS